MEGGFVIEVAMFIYIGRFVFASPLANICEKFPKQFDVLLTWLCLKLCSLEKTSY